VLMNCIQISTKDMRKRMFCTLDIVKLFSIFIYKTYLFANKKNFLSTEALFLELINSK